MREIKMIFTPKHFYSVGQGGVKLIVQHAAQGEGDKWYYDVEFDSGELQRLFTFDEVLFSAEQEDKSTLTF